MIKNGDMNLVINTPSAGMIPRRDENIIRMEAINRNVGIITTISAAQASVKAIQALHSHELEVKPLQDYYKGGGMME